MDDVHVRDLDAAVAWIIYENLGMRDAVSFRDAASCRAWGVDLGVIRYDTTGSAIPVS